MATHSQSLCDGHWMMAETALAYLEARFCGGNGKGLDIDSRTQLAGSEGSSLSDLEQGCFLYSEHVSLA